MRLVAMLILLAVGTSLPATAHAGGARKAGDRTDPGGEVPTPGCLGGTPPGGEGPWRIHLTTAPGVEVGRIFRYNQEDLSDDRKWVHYVSPATGWTWMSADSGWIVDVDPTPSPTASCSSNAKCQLLDVEAVTMEPGLDGATDSVSANANTFRSYAYHPTGLYAVSASIYAPNGSFERIEFADLYVVAEGSRARRELFCASPTFEWPKADRDDPPATDHRVDWRIEWVDSAPPPMFCPPGTVRYEFLLKVQ